MTVPGFLVKPVVIPFLNVASFSDLILAQFEQHLVYALHQLLVGTEFLGGVARIHQALTDHSQVGCRSV